VTAPHWEIVKVNSIWAVRWERIRDKIKRGDFIVFYLVGSNPPAIVGIYEVAGEWRRAEKPIWTEEIETGEVKYPWQVDLNKIALGAIDLRKLSQELRFIENKSVWSVYLRGSPANFGRPLSQADFDLINSEMSKPPIQIQIATVKERVEPLPQVEAEGEGEKAKEKDLPNHNKLRDMIQEIGTMRGLVSEIECPIDGWRLDVTWRRPVRKTPDQAWEVQIGGNFYEALAKLKHAWDIWGSEPYLVTTEKYENEARSLLGGTFHEMSAEMRIINYRRVLRLYELLREAAGIEKDIGLTSK
jgi:predicted RNA-binding protein